MHSISAENTKLCYKRSGFGERILFAFHGFGQDHRSFANLTLNYPQELYTIYAFDLFYHGESKHPFSQEVRPFIWKHMLNRLMTMDGIKEIEIVCYSVGSVFAISTFMLFPEKVRTIMFIAPDGIKNSSLYDIATSTYGKPLFYRLMKKPLSLIKLLNLLSRFNVFPKILHRFIMLQLRDRSKRMVIYTSWVNFKPLYYEFEAFRDMCDLHLPTLTFYLGKKDQIIKSSVIKPRIKELPNASIVELRSNHHKMIFETINYLLKDKK